MLQLVLWVRLQAASALTNLLTFLAYVFPLIGGYLGDSTIGRWKAIQWGYFWICWPFVFILLVSHRQLKMPMLGWDYVLLQL